MDQLMVDITGIPRVKTGDIAVLIGKSGNESISVGDIAEKAGTITNEILSRMGTRLERIIT
ncbi:Alanine racemase 1 [bioreactor metagenome]|uniref:Alanine racemase 1 n=1 Tax=bioreactor metagenome TaxID=1076179 RepID=A0A645FNS1_9ZZZZ